MMNFLLIYTHIAALVLGLVFNEWWNTRRSFWVDVLALLFIGIAWPWALYLIVRDARKGP